MPNKPAQSSRAGGAIPNDHTQNSKSLPDVPAAELLSFLKQTRGAQTWTEKDFAKALRIGLPEAKQAILVLQLQGYIQAANQTGKWRITEEGNLVSGSKSPRFTRQSVEQALDDLRDRIKALNEDANSHYKIADAVAFGDFLGDEARVQAAEVGIRLAPKKGELPASAKEHRAQLAFLRQLRGKTALLHIRSYEDWMRSRSHRDPL
jgi:hypothetical protein